MLRAIVIFGIIACTSLVLGSVLDYIQCKYNYDIDKFINSCFVLFCVATALCFLLGIVAFLEHFGGAI